MDDSAASDTDGRTPATRPTAFTQPPPPPLPQCLPLKPDATPRCVDVTSVLRR